MNRLQTQLAYIAVALVALVAACTTETSDTDLYTAGPPEIAQVRLKEVTSTGQERTVFAFGTHPDAVDMNGDPDPAQEHQVTSASGINTLRIIVDELLIGNSLEEVECRGQVDDDAYDRVPVDATPDDIARCSAPKDVLPTSCTGDNAMCICHRPGGCVVGTDTFAVGVPLGVLDANQDGAADDTRFIRDAAGITCGSIKVDIDLSMSYYTPSGNQNVPAHGGFDALGPAIVLAPTSALPTNQDCHLTFAPDVTDKENNQICTPPNGDFKTPCTPGDVSLFTFKTVPMSVVVQSFADNGTGVSRTDPIILVANVPMATDVMSKIQIATTAGNTPFTTFTATLMNQNRALFIQPTGTGFAAMTAYTFTVPTTVTDSAGSPLPAPYVIHFTTGA